LRKRELGSGLSRGPSVEPVIDLLVGSSVSRHDRITLPEDLRPFARDSERRFETASSDVRPLVPLSAVPWLVVTFEDLRRLPLDARAGFVVSRIDGRSSVEMLLDLCALPEGETLDIVAELVRLGAIELRDPP
jgi:hypothetical protein